MRYSPPTTRFQITWLSRALLMLSLGIFLSACPDKKPKYPNCGSDKDCKDGQHCFNKHCSECSKDSHCEDFESCNAGSCVLKDGMCNTSDDCSDGKICEDNKCVACQDDRECGEGGRCSNGACLTRGSCNADEDCADDEDCVDGACKRPGRDTAPSLSCQMDSVYFGFDEFSVPDNAKVTLQSTSECIQQGAERSVFLEGHTDATGTEEYNIALSEKRARTIADFLARLGIDPSRLRVNPKGESESTGTDGPSRSQDRRVDFEWQ